MLDVGYEIEGVFVGGRSLESTRPSNVDLGSRGM